MYRRLLIIAVLSVLTSACVPYGGGSYYSSEVYTVDRYPSGYYPETGVYYNRGYYVAPAPRYYVPAPRYYRAGPPPPGWGYSPRPYYRADQRRGPDPGWHPGPRDDRRYQGRPGRNGPGPDRPNGGWPGRGYNR